MNVNAKPADFVLVHMPGQGGKVIRVLQWLNGDGFSDYEHVALYVGNGQVIEMMSGGIRLAPLAEYDALPQRWSTGILNPTGEQRAAIVAAAHGYLARKISYSPEDYASLVARHFHIPVPGLRAYIRNTVHMICSQFADQCWDDGGYHIFKDGRWPGDVTPGDLDQALGPA